MPGENGLKQTGEKHTRPMVMIGMGLLYLLSLNPAQAFTTNQSADWVLGQPDMAGACANQCTTPSAKTLNVPSCVNTDGTRLLIVDESNHRVLIFNTLPSGNDPDADVVVGQPDMSSRLANQGGGCQANTLAWPFFAWSDGTRLFVTDAANSRALIYNTIPSSNNASADVVIGQANMTSGCVNQCGPVGANTLNNPIAIISHGGRMFVSDQINHRVLIYNSIPAGNNASADVVVGQPDMVSNAENQGGAAGANTLSFPSGIICDGTRLLIADRGNHRVLIFNSIPLADNASADVVIGQPNMTSRMSNQGGSPGPNTLNNPWGVYVQGSQLYIADSNNNRVLIFDGIPLANNAAAAVVIGQADFISNSPNQGGGAAANTLYFPNPGVHEQDRLYILDRFNSRVLVFDQPPVAIIRSVGPGSTGSLAQGGANALTLSGSLAAFGVGLPARVGVGDVIQYDSDNNGSVDALAFIEARGSASQYTVRAADGRNVPPPTLAPDQDWAVFRAYTSLSDAEQAAENAGISAGLRDFDSWTGGKDLVAGNEVWNLACYADAVDTTSVEIQGWTTSADHYLRIYTPEAPGEVGAGQRHHGSWDPGAYRLEIASNNSVFRNGQINHLRLEGLQCRISSVSNPGTVGVSVESMGPGADIRISDCLFRGLPGTPQNLHLGIAIWSAGSGIVRAWNNVYYDFSGNAQNGGIGQMAAGFTLYAYNNTMVDCSRGIWANAGTTVAKNILAQACTDGFNGTFAPASDYNLSDLPADAPGPNARNTTLVGFVNAAGDDFHLWPGDTGARGHGVNLAADADLAFNDDLDREARPGTWDIGADQMLLPTFTPTISPTPVTTPTPTPTLFATSTVSATCSFTRTPLPYPGLDQGGGYATPNPFFPGLGQQVNFNFAPQDPRAACLIRILDLKGRAIRSLRQARVWDGRDDHGRLCEGGVYLYQVETEGKRVSGTVVLLEN